MANIPHTIRSTDESLHKRKPTNVPVMKMAILDMFKKDGAGSDRSGRRQTFLSGRPGTLTRPCPHPLMVLISGTPTITSTVITKGRK